MKELIAFLLGLMVVTASAEQLAADVTMKVTRSGIYKAVMVEQVAVPSLATGKRTLYDSVKFIRATNRIQAIKGICFGFSYNIEGPQNGQKVKMRTVCIYPGDGLKPPGDDTPHKSDSYTREVTIGDKATQLFTFQYEWELVPGDWVIQEWYGEKKLAEVGFTVEKPSK